MRNAVKFINDWSDTEMGKMFQLIPFANIWWHEGTVCVTVGWLFWNLQFWFNVPPDFVGINDFNLLGDPGEEGENGEFDYCPTCGSCILPEVDYDPSEE
jgi:hypothetical protein